MEIFAEIYRDRRIAEAGADANAAMRKAESVDSRVLRLEKRVEQLALTCQALWEILRETNAVEATVIADKILEIDLRDGVLDGKASPPPVTCPSCGRNGNSARITCLYCGDALPRQGV
jgi:hypothetical protein